MVQNRARDHKILNIAAVILFLLFMKSLSAENSEDQILTPFQGATADSKLAIDYTDLTQLLNAAVFKVGRSFRQKIERNRAHVGTRLKSSRKAHTTLEANRFDFKSLKSAPENIAVLDKILVSLIAVPDEIPLSQFTKSEQLAYWLNLYNTTLIRELVDLSSKSTLSEDLYGKNSILDKKSLRVAGVNLSLNDIQYRILYPKFNNDPLIIYGFYQGIIGAPDIRKKAYTGAQVYQQLADNAADFINSNRGVRQGTSGNMQVSMLYERNKELFPNFDNDLKQHLSGFVVDDYIDKVKKSETFTPSIRNSHIANITGGERSFGGFVSTNEAAMLDSGIDEEFIMKSSGQLSSDTIQMLLKLKTNKNLRTGTVSIKEDDGSETHNTDEENPEDYK